MRKNVLITGGAGFIGSNFVKLYIEQNLGSKIVVLDNMTYAANIENLKPFMEQIIFVQGDIGDCDLTFRLMQENNINYVYNFAAESHVDNSIAMPDIFIQTNVVGTFNLLKSARKYFELHNKSDAFRLIHISTDEVYGSLEIGDGRKFDEEFQYQPNSPYSASKAASDHIVRSFFHTYGLPCITTNCTNNYGSNQHPEKLIPKTILACRNKQKIPVYGKGFAVRDWIHVEDHCNGVILAGEKGRVGQTYCLGGNCEMNTLEVVTSICKIMNEIEPSFDHISLIEYVQDRPGHDMRYAMSCAKAEKELGFRNNITFEDGIRKLICE